MEYFLSNWLEISGAMLSMIYLYFSIREKSILWFFGFISSLLYIIVFFNKQFYAEVSINSYYLFVSVYGWINWQKKSNNKQEKALRISKISGHKEYMQYGIATLLIYFAYYFTLKLLNSPIAAADSVVGALSIIATWMLAKKKLENWLVFLTVDAYAAVLYFSKGLYPTTVLFIVYTIMAYIGYKEWKKNYSVLTSQP